MQRRILIIEKEAADSLLAAKYLAGFGPDYEVITAGSVSAGLRILNERQIDLVLSHHGGPGNLDGIELLNGAARLESAARIILKADANFETDCNKALSAGCDAFLVEPCPQERVCDLIYNMLQPERGFSGHVMGMKLEDVIEMLCFRKDSTLLTITDGPDAGYIYVHEGRIVHAVCRELTGVEAVYQLLEKEEGLFFSQVVFKIPAHTVFMDWQSLLMEGIRQKDEIRHALEPGPDAAVVPHRGNGSARTAISTRSVRREALRIMVVDDSRFIRRIVQEIVQSDPDLAVAGFAANGVEALARLDDLKPDLVLLDWDMPMMMGSTTLMHIMIRSPCPVVVLSGFVGGEGPGPFDLIGLGAVDFVRKPQAQWRKGGKAEDLLRRIKEACQVKYDRIRRIKVFPPGIKRPDSGLDGPPAPALIVLGAATGAGADLMRILPALPADMPAAVVVIHDMQTEALAAFIDYLDRRSRIRVRPVEHGSSPVAGFCYFQSAELPLGMESRSGKPSMQIVDVMRASWVFDRFAESASEIMGNKVLAVLLSGGPGPGVAGLRAVKKKGGITLVQDPASSLDPRMAASAVKAGIVDHVSTPDKMAETLLNLIKQIA